MQGAMRLHVWCASTCKKGPFNLLDKYQLIRLVTSVVDSFLKIDMASHLKPQHPISPSYTSHQISYTGRKKIISSCLPKPGFFVASATHATIHIVPTLLQIWEHLRGTSYGIGTYTYTMMVVPCCCMTRSSCLCPMCLVVYNDYDVVGVLYNKIVVLMNELPYMFIWRDNRPPIKSPMRGRHPRVY